MRRIVALWVGAMLLSVTALAGESLLAASDAPASPGFSRKPAVSRQGAGAKIEFAAAAPTDCAVSILDAQGRAVRHLAAGVLGKNAPEPFRKDSLEQSLVWDGNDDAGRPAGGGPFSVRVSLGSRPRLDKAVGFDGQTMNSRIVALAVGLDGELFVLLSDSHRGRSEMRVLDRAGKYVRTIMPYPANTPKERTASVGHLEVEGERLPIVYNGLGLTLHPLVNGMKMQNMAFSPKGHLVLASGIGTMAEHGPPRHLLAMHPQGGAPEGVNFVGPRFRKGTDRALGGDGEASTVWFDHLAVSPDGQWTYLTVQTNARGFKVRHGVWRVQWADAEFGNLWLGADAAGDDDAHMNDPAGLATDAAGNVYVCDRGNNRVLVFSPEGKLLGKWTVESPEQIAVHPASGEIYVLSKQPAGKLELAPATLLKFAPFKKDPPKELARLAGRQIGLMALDATASPAKLWLTADPGAEAKPGPRTLLAAVDRGDRFELTAAVNAVGGLNYPMHLAGDPDRDRVLVYQGGGITAVDLKTGKAANFVKGTDIALDRDGNIYVMDGYRTDSLSRYSPDGKPLPFASTNSHTIPSTHYRGYGPSLGFQGLAVRANGDIYVAGSDNYGAPGVYGGRVNVYGPDGALKSKGIIDGMGYGDCGLGVDAAGNMYVGVNLKPADKPFPEPFMGKVPAKRWTWWRFERDGVREPPWSHTYYNSYLFHWGSVMKFGPEGGAFYGQHPWNLKRPDYTPPRDFDLLDKAPADAVTLRSSYLGFDVKVAGMKWRYAGCGPVPSSGDGLTPDPGCVCYSSDLAVDPYGRVFAPNVFRFSVEMLDSAGNQIARIGRYGNADSAGAGSMLSEPEIAFAWPAYLSVNGGKLFVSDPANRRISVVRFEHAAEETVAVK